MTFREWISYPEPGNWVFVNLDVPAGARGATTLPKGIYLVMSLEANIYNLKNTTTNKVYQVFADDLDVMIKEKIVRAAQ
jgi:hypothetical protein